MISNFLDKCNKSNEQSEVSLYVEKLLRVRPVMTVHRINATLMMLIAVVSQSKLKGDIFCPLVHKLK